MKIKKPGWLLIIGAVVVLVVLLILVLSKNNNKSEYVFREVEKRTLEKFITATGTINPLTTVQVGTQVSGRIKEIYVDYNSQVKKGELLAEIDPALFQAQVDQARANLSTAQANLVRAKANYENSKKNYERAKELFEKELIARAELDNAETAFLSDQAQVTVATAQVAQAKANLENAETNLKYTKIISPIDGIIISRNVDIGQTVVASFQSPILFLVAEDMTKMQITTNVSEADIGDVKEGQEADFTVDAYPGLNFKGVVSQVRNSPTTIQNVVTYNVIVNVDNPELKLKPGMTANVSILVAKREEVLALPNEALRFSPPAQNSNQPIKRYDKPGVWILEKGIPKRIEVQLGITDGNWTEIISGELKEKTRVIVEVSKEKKAKATFKPPAPRLF